MPFFNYTYTKTNNCEAADKLQKEIEKIKNEDNTFRYTCVSTFADEDEITIQDKEESICKIFINAYLELVENPPYMEEATQRYIVKSINKEIHNVINEIKKNPDTPYLRYYDFED